MSKVIAEEQAITGQVFRIVSVAPGVVDTKMQEEIRNSPSEEFSRKDDFIACQARGHLLDPRPAASKYIDRIRSLLVMQDVVFSLKECDISFFEK